VFIGFGKFTCNDSGNSRLTSVGHLKDYIYIVFILGLALNLRIIKLEKWAIFAFNVVTFKVIQRQFHGSIDIIFCKHQLVRCDVTNIRETLFGSIDEIKDRFALFDGHGSKMG
jgi:hypothetical protein